MARGKARYFAIRGLFSERISRTLDRARLWMGNLVFIYLTLKVERKRTKIDIDLRGGRIEDNLRARDEREVGSGRESRRDKEK